MRDVKESAAVARDLAVRARSNSYNLVPVRDFTRQRGAPCPLRGRREVAKEGGRTLLVRLRDRMRLVRTTTSDFSEAELLATRRLGQVYADVSTKLAPTDFARDLRKLRPSDECTTCPDYQQCPGCWEAVPGDVFTRDDARVREILGELRGRVLDVGGGEAVYLAAFSPTDVDYVCVDPDDRRLGLLSLRHAGSPWARFVVGVAEELDPALGTFDHVLFLRSYNHLVDPALALSRALALLRPGGTLLIVDNVAFGLVRSGAHAARAEAAPENELEHYRNDGPDEADSVVRAAAGELGIPLRLQERRDIGPETSNQWLLNYR
jgi:SAM-dependent methyltransferase